MSVMDKDFIFLDENFNNRQEVFEFVSQKLYDSGRITDVEKVVNGVYEREKIFSTYMENGIAIPHCKISEVNETTVVVIRNNKKIVWNNEEECVDLIFMLVVLDESANKIHLKILAKIAQAIMDEAFIDIIKTADIEKVYNELKKLDIALIN